MSATHSYVVADTEYGKVKGIRTKSSLKTLYNAFYGIRFGAPPTGELRFKDPIKPAKWEEIYDATEEKIGCYENSSLYNKIVGTEDGLILNIFTKTINPLTPQPVLVYIYGGNFQKGSITSQVYGPDYLLMADVVIVNVSFRSGAFGFLNLKDKELNVPGNAGLKDQRLALKFVKNNIQNFGGDPDNITLFGHSSGACCISWHCVSEGSKGLFNKAILMSGSVLNTWSLTPYKDWAKRLADKLGYKGSDIERDILKYLQEADPVKIVENQELLLRPDEPRTIIFAPHLEHYKTEETFISKPALELFRVAWSNDIDILIGGTADEGLIELVPMQKNPQLLSDFKVESVVPAEIGLELDHPKVIDFIDNLKKQYYPTSYDPTEDKMAYSKIKNDGTYWHGFQRFVQGRQNYGGKGKTYLYRFAVDSPTQNHYRIKRFGPDMRGVCHCDEISYLFKEFDKDVPEQGSMEFKSIVRFVSLFTSFAATGNPNDNIIQADMEDVIIDPVSGLEPPFKAYNMQENVSFIPLPESEQLAMWDRLYKDTNTPLF